MDFPSRIGYLAVNHQPPNFATDGISLEELITDFLINVGKVTPSSFDVDTFLSNLTTLLNDTQNASDQLWSTVESQAKIYLNAFSIAMPDGIYTQRYVMQPFYPDSANGSKSLGLFQVIQGHEYVCIVWHNDSDGNPINCAYGHWNDRNDIIETEGLLTLASKIGFPASLENIVLLKTDGMAAYPTNPYFFTWVVHMTQGLGTQYKPNFLSELNDSTPIIPSISATLEMLNPYEAYVTIHDRNGNNILNTLDVQIKSSTGAVIGQGQIFNGAGYVSANGYSNGAQVVVLGNDFYYPATYDGYLTYHTTTTNVSLVLDPNAPTGTNPYVADVTLTDNNGNMAMGRLNVTVTDPSNGNRIVSGYAENGTAQITLPDYYQSVSVIVEDDDNYFYT